MIKKMLLLFACLSLCAWAPVTFTNKSFTKTLTYRVKGLQALYFEPYTSGTIYLNGTGTGWTFATKKNTEVGIFRNVSTIKFAMASTAYLPKFRAQEGR